MVTEFFIPEGSFVVGTSMKDLVNIFYVGEAFKKRFYGKKETLAYRVQLVHIDLDEPLTDEEIICKLGGKEKVETFSYEMFAQMEKQGNGEVGELLVNGKAGIFYIIDKFGELCSVRCSWSKGGWCVLASGVYEPEKWGVGNRVFFPIT